ncbi:hypothetical protein [Desulfatibacillum aliphaticivorans]|uniref:Uncharacterized protein n=1 Tax=Desulfatibacillum aliphaticivorans TaxID=218208 RepID=B8FCB8_DESAL|nr:hypothetical protein [Desulfatibacillum aliphaticivorans]ACL05536.1 hypothetical protein Dalk_3850 [Desulfatibacillum aliphaticivorans]
MSRIEELEEQIKAMQRTLEKKEIIQKVLMDRVEKSINSSGNAYTLFESNLVLQEQVDKRTKELQEANRELRIEIENRRKVEKEKESLISELQQALAEVKVLSGLLPICSYCKDIRNDKGYWQKIETYIGDHSSAQFSHSICNKCMKKHLPELYEKMMEEQKKP